MYGRIGMIVSDSFDRCALNIKDRLPGEVFDSRCERAIRD